MHNSLEWSGLTAVNASNSEQSFFFNVHGHVFAGQMLGIIGVNGSGKTSILNALSGRVPHSGNVLFNGLPRPANWISTIVYVQREIPIAMYQTVRELIFFSARLKMPFYTSNAQINARVDELIMELGLDSVADEIVSTNANPLQISLGDMRKTAIAIQIAHDPGVIFVDEPFHGLDSSSGYSLMLWLKNLALSSQKMIIVSFGQARIRTLLLLDGLLVMHRGKQLYFGTLQGACDTFGLPWPFDPEILLDFLMQHGNEFDSSLALHSNATLSASSSQPNNSTNNIQLQYESTIWQQISQLLARDVRIHVRQGEFYAYSLAQNAFLTAIQCIWFHNSHPSVKDMKNFNNSIMLVGIYYLSMITIPLETIHPLIRKLIRREQYENTYRLCASFISKAILYACLRIAGQIIFLFISYYIVGYQAKVGLLFYTLAIQVLFVYAAVGLGLAISGMFTTVLMAQIIGPMIVILNIFLSGNAVTTGTLTWIVRWAQYLSVVYWLFRGVFQVQLATRSANSQEWEELLRDYEFTSPGPWFSCLMLAVIGSCWYLIGAVSLSFRYRNAIFI